MMDTGEYHILNMVVLKHKKSTAHFLLTNRKEIPMDENAWRAVKVNFLLSIRLSRIKLCPNAIDASAPARVPMAYTSLFSMT